MKLSTTFSLAVAMAAQPAASRDENACGQGNGVSIVTVSGGQRREPEGTYDDGNYYDFLGSLDNLDCSGVVDFKTEGDLGPIIFDDMPAHPFKLCVGGVNGGLNGTSKCASRFEEGCGTECFEYQVGDIIKFDGDCTSINVAGRELWYVCTREPHDMYNRLC